MIKKELIRVLNLKLIKDEEAFYNYKSARLIKKQKFG
jgi:hypothetical protein